MKLPQIQSPMLRLVGQRLLKAIPLILAIVICNFVLLKLAPGDAAEVLAGEAAAGTAEYLAELRARFGLDQPVYMQLWHYIVKLATLDLGFSFRHNQTVLSLILDRLPATLLLMFSGMGLAVVFGATLGVLASQRVNQLRDNIISVFAILSFSVPVFWLGLMLIVVFSVNLGWFPAGGMETMASGKHGVARMLDVLQHMVMPVTTLGLFYVALYTRVMRASMLEVFNQDYVTTARAKGLSERRITFRHVFRNEIGRAHV